VAKKIQIGQRVGEHRIGVDARHPQRLAVGRDADAVRRRIAAPLGDPEPCGLGRQHDPLRFLARREIHH